MPPLTGLPRPSLPMEEVARYERFKDSRCESEEFQLWWLDCDREFRPWLRAAVRQGRVYRPIRHRFVDGIPPTLPIFDEDEVEDLVATAMTDGVESLRTAVINGTYDPGRGYPLRDDFLRRCQYKLIGACKKRTRQRARTILAPENKWEVLLRSIRSPDVVSADSLALSEALQAAFDQFDDPYLPTTVVMMLYEGYSQVEIAHLTNTTDDRIGYIVKQLRHHLTRWMKRVDRL